ncbi:A/G-specific adenine glycosylase [soil metagenome]
MSFGEIIIGWYQKNKRDLPWRHTSDPYKIWLSEIILQQTRVDQGLDYYKRFISRYPTVKKLAAAHEDDVLKLWQGLGYYSRARNLHFASKDIVKRFKGKFPVEYEDILSLKGIGSYTAAAIASFAFKKKYAVVDGNVFRVLSRYLGIKTPVNSPSAKKEFYEASMQLMDDHASYDFNQAIMEFGALQCKPQNPLCASCPLAGPCYAFAKKNVHLLPVKGRKIKVRTRYFHYLYIHKGKNIYVRKRTGNDIWKNMYDFPLIETQKKITTDKLMQLAEWKNHFFKKNFLLLSESKTIKHQLTHQTIFARFFEIRTSSAIKTKGIQSIHHDNLSQLAIPRLIENYLKGDLK